MVTPRSKRSILACCLLGHGSAREFLKASNPLTVDRECPEELESSSVMGQWEQKRFLVEGGLGERRRLRIGAEQARFRIPRRTGR
ncbi:hypothetical protein M8994_06785 [Brucella sp. 21LCYQ03]|nr:hypothetical protein [Brucella sp. 21LCYQ03]